VKYSKQITDEIAKHLEGGTGRVDACTLAGLTFETFNQWMKDPRKPEFSESIKKAEAKCKQRNIQLIQKAALDTWQAAAWWLERKHRDEFALLQKLEHSGLVGNLEVKGVDLSRFSDAQLAKLADALERFQPKE